LFLSEVSASHRLYRRRFAQLVPASDMEDDAKDVG
jgi:hypothetical protein